MRNASSGWITRGERAYGSAISLRWKLTDGSYSCILHVVKAFVAPSKKKSVPCLELTGCLSIARLYITCKEALKFAERSTRICKKEFWIHSQTMSTRRKTSPRKFKLFVLVRVAEIQETMGSEACKYIRSDHNLADVLMRGTWLEKLKTWYEGPPFLKYLEEESPKFKENPNGCEEFSEEIKPLNNFKAVNTLKQVDCSATSTESKGNPILEYLMKSCLTFAKARKTLANVLRFTNSTRLKVKKRHHFTEELRESKLWLFKWS